MALGFTNAKEKLILNFLLWFAIFLSRNKW